MGESGDFIILSMPDDFDFDRAFRSEKELAEGHVAETAPVEAVSVGDAAQQQATPERETVPVDADGQAAVVRDEFPAAADGQAAVARIAVSVADLIESHVRLDWHEAVAIAQQLCRELASDPSASVQCPLVEPWNTDITNLGEVMVLPSGPSGDPLVKQVGRVLRALLRDTIAPAELRLIASQAAFEVPVYASLEELLIALQPFERPNESDAIRAAFQRAAEARQSGTPRSDHEPSGLARVGNRAVGSGWLAVDQRRAAAARPIPRAEPSRTISRFFTRARVVPFAALILFGVLRALMVSSLKQGAAPAEEQPDRTRILASSTEPVKATIPEAAPPVAPGAGTADEVEVSRRAAQRPSEGPRAQSRARATVARPAEPGRRAAGGREAEVVIGSQAPRLSPENLRATPLASRSIATTQPRFTPNADIGGLAESRAAALSAEGRTEEAAIAFDAIVMKNPLYHLDPARSSPEALAALKASKQSLIPAIARMHYEDARAAYDAGDTSRAVLESQRAAAMLKELDPGTVPYDLSDNVAGLVRLATVAMKVQEEKIYSAADTEVSPPKPIGSQLPSAAPRGVPSGNLGRLEIVVNRAGHVESVKLYTPMNGYQDRMIVSAAKAWRFRPALKNGKPVRFSLEMAINLPEL